MKNGLAGKRPSDVPVEVSFRRRDLLGKKADEKDFRHFSQPFDAVADVLVNLAGSVIVLFHEVGLPGPPDDPIPPNFRLLVLILK
jgi:hypothetical protein